MAAATASSSDSTPLIVSSLTDTSSVEHPYAVLSDPDWTSPTSTLIPTVSPLILDPQIANQSYMTASVMPKLPNVSSSLQHPLSAAAMLSPMSQPASHSVYMVHDSVVTWTPDPVGNVGTTRTPTAVHPHPLQHAHHSADSCLHTLALGHGSSPSSSSTPPLSHSTHLPEHTASLVAYTQHSKFLLDGVNID